MVAIFHGPDQFRYQPISFTLDGNRICGIGNLGDEIECAGGGDRQAGGEYGSNGACAMLNLTANFLLVSLWEFYCAAGTTLATYVVQIVLLCKVLF